MPRRATPPAFDAAFATIGLGRRRPPPPPPPPRPAAGPVAFGYARVSTDRQATKGHSLEAQAAAIRDYARSRGLGEVCLLVEGGTSAKVPFADREAGAETLRRLRPGDHLLMTRVDRGFRNLVDFLTWFDRWQQRGIHLHILDFSGLTIDPRSATGRLFVHMMAAVAQWERETNGERVREAFAERRARGLPVGGKPRRGFKAAKDGRGRRIVVPDPYARSVMGKMVEWADAGLSNAEVTAHLIAHDVELPGGLLGWNEWNVCQYTRDERRLRAAEAPRPEAADA